MYDKSLISDMINNVKQSLENILEWTEEIISVSDFLDSPTGIILLNAVCMKLFAVGEEIKSIDKRTGKLLFADYPAINWQEAMKMRDVIAHHYFELDADVVFDTLQNDVRPLLQTIIHIKKDLDKL
jgi:uncharacterized protein with HEPN domain